MCQVFYPACPCNTCKKRHKTDAVLVPDCCQRHCKACHAVECPDYRAKMPMEGKRTEERP